jgi:hypothetical protein
MVEESPRGLHDVSINPDPDLIKISASDKENKYRRPIGWFPWGNKELTSSFKEKGNSEGPP